MDDLLKQIGGDSTLMFTAAIALVVLLFIVLLIVITSMRVKSYKDRFINIQIDNQEKEKQIADLQNELQSLKIKNAQNEQELQQFAQTREKLQLTEEGLSKLQHSSNELEKLQGQTQSKLEHMEEKYHDLLQEHTQLQERFEAVQEENSKLHINNARLLMKLETEARFSAQQREKNRESKGEKS